MIRLARIGLMTWFTLMGAWRRWILFIPLGLTAIVFLSQLPRVFNLASIFSAPGREAEALDGYAAFLTAMYDDYVLMGALLALALGAVATGSRRLRSHLLPILARPLARLDFILGRAFGNFAVIIVFWALPMVAFEAVRILVHAPVRVALSAYVTPLLLHMVLLALGMALGSFMPALPATFSGYVIAFLILVFGAGTSSPWWWLRILGSVSVWVAPPLQSLLSTAAPFTSPGSVLHYGALHVQALAWIGIFLTLTVWRYERMDFTARSH